MSINNEVKTVLLTGGRAPCTLELARAFFAAGHRVLVAESVRHHLCGASRAVTASFQVPAPNEYPQLYIAAIEAIVLQEKVDVLIPTCEEIFYIAKGLDVLSRHCKVWAAPLEQLSQLHNKWTFAGLAEQLGLNVPQSKLIKAPEELLAYAHEHLYENGFVLKPAYSRFGSHVMLLPNREQTAAVAHDKQLNKMMSALAEGRPWVAQRRIKGSQLCTYSVAYEGELLAHTAYPCRYSVGQGTAIYFEAIQHGAALEWVRKLVKELCFTGQISFDFIEEESSGELYAIECNPRATSGLHLFDIDDGLVKAFLQPHMLTGGSKLITPRPSSKRMITAAMLTAGLVHIRNFHQLRSWFHAFRSTRDVVISRRDMKPGIKQLRVAFELWRTSRARNITLQQATTIDIEWNGDA